MKTFNRNSTISWAFLLLGMFCGLLLITSVFIKGNTLNSGDERISNSFFASNQENSLNKLFQEPGATLPDNILLIFGSIEESEQTDDTAGEDTINSSLPLHTLSLSHNFFKSSFVSFSLSFHKRITIPFFLLHHSLKIPFA